MHRPPAPELRADGSLSTPNTVVLRGIASLVTITSEGDFSELTLRLLIGPEMMDVAC